jgi:hypothetical protein
VATYAARTANPTKVGTRKATLCLRNVYAMPGFIAVGVIQAHVNHSVGDVFFFEIFLSKTAYFILSERNPLYGSDQR